MRRINMRTFTLRTVNENNEVIKETNLTISENSILIHKVPINMRSDNVKLLHDHIVDALREGMDVITIPDVCKFEVLEIN
jgi:hypothetical protein